MPPIVDPSQRVESEPPAPQMGVTHSGLSHFAQEWARQWISMLSSTSARRSQGEGSNMRRLSAITVLTGVLLAAPASVAMAHECIVVNRSATGSENAGNSGNWFYVTTDDIIVFITGDPTLVPVLSEPFRDAVAAAGLPTEFAIFENRTLGTNSDGSLTPGYTDLGHSNDGKGIEHLFTGGYAAQYDAILFGLLP
jgi:hypothetical protein